MLPRTLESSVLDGDLRIGDYVVRPLLKVIRPDSERVTGDETTLPDKAMAVLVYLAQHSRQVCDREDILDAVWGPERDAYDRVLDNAIREIRRALNDDARNPTYIQTIPKKGYRLLVPVESRLLEKQRDSSGEFVPIAKDSAQVFQRVRRSSTAAGSANPHTDVRTVDATRPRKRLGRAMARPGRLALSIAAILLILLTAAAWRSGGFGSEGVTVAIDTGDLDSDGTNASDYVKALRTALFEEHACGARSLYRPDSWLRAADFEIRLGRSDDGAAKLLTAEIAPTRHKAIILLDPDRKTGPTSLARQTVEQMDRVVCDVDRLPDENRACHCLEGSRRWASLPDSQASVEQLELAITLDPELIPAYGALAEAFQAGGNFGAGMSVLKTGLAKIEDPDSTEGLGLRLQLARLLEDPSEEERLLERLRRRHPDDPKWRLARAAYLTVHRRQCEDALDLLEPLMSPGHRSASVTVEASRALWFCGRKQEMIEMVTEQVERLPRQGELRWWLAILLTLTGRYDEATDFATEATALEPEQSEPYWVLGLVAERQGHYSTAETWYRKAGDLARWPKQEDRVSVGLARIARLRGDAAGCIELTESLEDSAAQTHESPTLLRGLCLVEAGRTPEARRALEDFTSSLVGQSSAAYRSRALALRGEIEMAEAATPEARRQAASRFVEAAEAHPIRVDRCYFEAAEALAEVGEVIAAMQWFDKALEVNPNHPWSLCGRGLLQQERGDQQAAAESMRRGLEVFGPRLEDPLAIRCADALSELDPDWAESTDAIVQTMS